MVARKGHRCSSIVNDSFVDVAVARLSAELAGPLTDDDLFEAQALTTICTAFGTFVDLIHADDGYFPKLHSYEQKDAPKFRRLADLYDRAQRHRGDPRRAVRLGSAGL